MVLPRYLNLTAAELSKRATQLRALASPCRLCPRACGVERDRGERGFCGAPLVPWVASFGPHFGEEEVLVGKGGSGTIFFSGCVLRCVYCQNATISQLGEGTAITVHQLARIMLHLQASGCENINLVTPTHQAPPIVAAVEMARDNGLRLPLVWNCGGYESVDALRLLEGIVDIYMPDFKYGDNAFGAALSAVPDYVDRAQEALREMHRQVGDLVVDGGIAVRGLLVRHLVLPDGLAGSEAVLSFIAREISPNTFVNVMAQYRPAHRAREHPLLRRPLSGAEHAQVLALAHRMGLRRAGAH
ncbi:MAG: radical activating enzyme [Candidatus Bipolaricaulis sibiricus]|uniref:Radical activating enzyme n=1 Tax=Bipolaricaulis sibiricus TaxID=2501609 RepID=A0A410FVD1_BIPS1|nr:MAG: radical activating enzyme [Candidatus Bipolaricaulis sibiricus]